MTIGELLDSMCESENFPHSNGKHYTLEQVRAMKLVVATGVHRPYKMVLSVYPSDDEKTMYIDME